MKYTLVILWIYLITTIKKAGTSTLNATRLEREMLHKVKSTRQGPESESDVARWVRSTFTLGAVRVPQLHH